MAESPTLLPCPFCGGTEQTILPCEVTAEEERGNWVPCEWYGVVCQCMATSRAGRRDKEARLNWNQRAGSGVIKPKPAIDWVPFDPKGKLPPERQSVLVQFSKIWGYGVGAVAVGYLRYAAGDKDSPFFVVPAVLRTNPYPRPDAPPEEMVVTHWADVFGGKFE